MCVYLSSPSSSIFSTLSKGIVFLYCPKMKALVQHLSVIEIRVYISLSHPIQLEYSGHRHSQLILKLENCQASSVPAGLGLVLGGQLGFGRK